ncbi:hypothetical protein B5P43_14360 [Bacillus sp. SRB_336]|nr:hypothetical protein B5P43_14360 [Bacillus sp. SRB_336]
MVPEPAKKKAYQKVVAAGNAHAEAAAVANANLLAVKSPAEGTNEITVTRAMHNSGQQVPDTEV